MYDHLGNFIIPIAEKKLCFQFITYKSVLVLKKYQHLFNLCLMFKVTLH